MWYIVFISHSLHWHYIETTLQEYVIKKQRMFSFTAGQRYNFLHFQGQVWAKTMNTMKVAGGTKAIHL